MFNGDDNRNKREDSLESILEDYENRQSAEAQSKLKKRKVKSSKKKAKRVVLLIEIVILIVAVFRVLFILAEGMDVFEAPKYWAIGKKHLTDDDTEKCIGNLWKIRHAIDKYYAEQKKLPKTLAELYTGKYLEEKPVCPSSGKEYVLKEKYSSKVYACPSPEDHGAEELWIYEKNGPPVFDEGGDNDQ